MEIYKREGGQTLWSNQDCEGNEVFGWSNDKNGVPCEPASVHHESEDAATESRNEEIEMQFKKESAIAVLDENGDHLADAYVFPVEGGLAYVDMMDGWRPITKEDAERLVGPLVSA